MTDGSLRLTTVRGVSFYRGADQEGFFAPVDAGDFEPATFAAIDRCVTPETVFLDIGANLGAITLYAVAKAGRVISVEADPINAAALRRNVAANPALAPKITIVERVVYPTPGKVRFGSRRGGGDPMSSFVYSKMRTAWEIDAVTPDELAGMIPPGAPLFIKMDIEGGEYDVIPAADRLLRWPHMVLLLSLHPQFLARRKPVLNLPYRLLKTRRMFRHLRGLSVEEVGHDTISPRPDLERRIRGGSLWAIVEGSFLFGAGDVRRTTLH